MPISFSHITIEVYTPKAKPPRPVQLGRISIERIKPLLKELTFSNVLPFMPAKTISGIEISAPEEASNLPLAYADPLVIDLRFGEDPNALRVDFTTSFTATDLITAETYAVATAYTAQKPTLSYL